jgi:hypothetical protein
MPEFFQLSPAERLDALNVAADATGLPPHLLEKDIWVVWALRHLFSGPYAEHLVFKGGTSLSKAYGVIRRFSEDVDLTYDIRAIAGDLVGDAGTPLPATKSQAKKWSTEIRARLADWVSTEIVPRLQSDLERSDLPATVRAEGDKVFIEYKPLTFPIATPHVMRAERTFWEKATAIHVFCAQGEFRGGDRFARHWHDITRLDSAGFVDAALADKALAAAVAEHKNVFFAEKNTQGETIEYHAAVTGGLQLVPDDGALAKLRIDYQHMIDDGLFLDDAEPFETLMERCRAIQQKANAN